MPSTIMGARLHVPRQRVVRTAILSSGTASSAAAATRSGQGISVDRIPRGVTWASRTCAERIDRHPATGAASSREATGPTRPGRLDPARSSVPIRTVLKSTTTPSEFAVPIRVPLSSLTTPSGVAAPMRTPLKSYTLRSTIISGSPIIFADSTDCRPRTAVPERVEGCAEPGAGVPFVGSVDTWHLEPNPRTAGEEAATDGEQCAGQRPADSATGWPKQRG